MGSAIYHWAAHRITSHVTLCVLALPLERAAEIRAGDTRRNIRLVLEEVTAIRERGGRQLFRPAHCSPAVAALLKKLDIPAPQPHARPPAIAANSPMVADTRAKTVARKYRLKGDTRGFRRRIQRRPVR